MVLYKILARYLSDSLPAEFRVLEIPAGGITIYDDQGELIAKWFADQGFIYREDEKLRYEKLNDWIEELVELYSD